MYKYDLRVTAINILIMQEEKNAGQPERSKWLNFQKKEMCGYIIYWPLDKKKMEWLSIRLILYFLRNLYKVQLKRSRKIHERLYNVQKLEIPYHTYIQIQIH